MGANEVFSEVMEQDNKFLTIRADPRDVTILKIQWFKKPVIEVGIQAISRDGRKNTYSMVLVDKGKITQMLNLLSIKVREFYDTFKSTWEYSDGVEIILKKAINAYDGDLYFKSSSFTDNYTGEMNWYAFAITTERHVTVPHKLLEKKIKTKFKDFEVVREEFHYTPVWHVKLRSWKLKEGDIKLDDLTAFIVISGGRNVKRGRIKIVPLVKVGSCDNTIRAIEYIEINHTSGWEDRFDRGLETAHDMLTKVREVLRLSVTKKMSYDVIEALVTQRLMSGMKIRKEKIPVVVKAVMNRVNQIQKEKENLTAWDMTQAMTYVGTHPEEIGIEDVMTEHSQEQLQTMGYNLLIDGIPDMGEMAE